MTNGRKTCLGIDVLQTAHDDAGQGIGLLGLLIESLGMRDGAVEDLFVLEAVNVLCAVGVDVLQTAGELVIETVDEADDGAADANDAVLLIGRDPLLKFVIVFRDLLDIVLVRSGNDANQLIDLALSLEPDIRRHVGGNGRVVVEARRDEGEQYTDALVCGTSDAEECFQDLNLRGTIGVL